MSSPDQCVAPLRAAPVIDALDCIADGIAVFDADGALLACNRAYRDLNPSIADLIAPGARFEALVLTALKRSDGPVASLPAEADVKERLAQHRRADGIPAVRPRGDKWLMATVRRTPEGGTVLVETDITELKMAELARYEFLAKVSHELRTPLTPIHGALALMASGKAGCLSGKLEELVGLASRNCTRLVSIVNDLLDFTRISAGRFALDRARVALEPLVQQVVAARRLVPGAPAIDVNVSPLARRVELEIDPLRIQQVLDNLLTNASKFSPTGARIEVNVDLRERALRISVVDRGPGIPKHFRARVFDVFAQASTSAKSQGAGLGLSICKSIVEAHGGRIGFVSNEGEGTTFFFELPVPLRKGSAATSPRLGTRERREAAAPPPQHV